MDLFTESKIGLELKGGTLSVVDSSLDKPYSHHRDLVGYFGSGKQHGVVKGITLITLYYTAVRGHHRPVNYRIYDKAEGKTKNDYFQEMLADVLAWGLEPAVVTGDSGSYKCRFFYIPPAGSANGGLSEGTGTAGQGSGCPWPRGNG